MHAKLLWCMLCAADKLRPVPGSAFIFAHREQDAADLQIQEGQVGVAVRQEIEEVRRCGGRFGGSKVTGNRRMLHPQLI